MPEIDASSFGVWIVIALILTQFFWGWRRHHREESASSRKDVTDVRARFQEDLGEAWKELERVQKNVETQNREIRKEIREDKNRIFGKLNRVAEENSGQAATLAEIGRSLRSLEVSVSKLTETKVSRDELS